MKATKKPAAQAAPTGPVKPAGKEAANDAVITNKPALPHLFVPHRVTRIFPRPTASQAAELAQSIRTIGQLVPITVVRGQIIDGLARLDACKETGAEPVYEHLDDLDEKAILEHCISRNLHRRHLDESQRAMVGASISEYQVGANQHSKDGISQGQAAKTMNVSVDTLQRAKKVLDKGVPELKAAVTAGTVDVTNAAVISTLPAASQADVLALEPKRILEAAKKINLERKAATRQAKLDNIIALRNKSTPLQPNGDKFEVLWADPPWDYLGPLGTEYPTMTLKAIKELPVAHRAAANAVLFLWVPASLVEEGLEVTKAWGFKFKTTAVWRKGESGLGGLLRVNHELLFIGTRGDVPSVAKAPASCFDAPRGKHSEKPQIAFDMIEAMYPQLTKLELFCRGEPRKGWAGWGNECVGSIDMPLTAVPMPAANESHFQDIGDQLLAALGSTGNPDVGSLKRVA